jgi:hypothetical protein
MVLDGPFGTACDEHQRISAGRQRFVHRILDERLIDDGQHFFRTGLGDRKKSRAAAGNGKHGGFYGSGLHLQMITDFNPI